jgi:hypothetical protein
VHKKGHCELQPGRILSDDDDGSNGHAYYSGRWTLLLDLLTEFEGAFGAYLLFAFIIPGGMLASIYFEKIENPDLMLVGAGAVFISLLSISAYTFVWYLWAKKRERLAFKTMQRRENEELALEKKRKDAIVAKRLGQ